MMIDNITLLITGTLHQRPITELISKFHPLDSFEQIGAIHPVASTPAELYNACAGGHSISQLASFFVDLYCISEEDLDEINIKIICNTLYKTYLESKPDLAYLESDQYCQKLGDTTADVMCEILAVSHLTKQPAELMRHLIRNLITV